MDKNAGEKAKRIFVLLVIFNAKNVNKKKLSCNGQLQSFNKRDQGM
jgi:hypothetical protein